MTSEYLKRKRELPLWKQLQDRCEHFNGLANDVCRAGIAYDDVQDTTTSPYGLPCLTKYRSDATVCANERFLTDKEAQQREADLYTRAQTRVDREQAGLCGQCGARVERKAQVGPCLYNEPCGCRLGQGRLK